MSSKKPTENVSSFDSDEAFKEALSAEEEGRREILGIIRGMENDARRDEDLRPEEQGEKTRYEALKAWFAALFAFVFTRPFFSSEQLTDAEISEAERIKKGKLRDRMETLSGSSSYRLPEMDLEPISRSMRISHVSNAERAYDAVSYLRDRISDLEPKMSERGHEEMMTTAEEAMNLMSEIAGRVIYAREQVSPSNDAWAKHSAKDPEQVRAELMFGSLLEDYEFLKEFVKAAGHEPDGDVEDTASEIIRDSRYGRIGVLAMTAINNCDKFSSRIKEYINDKVHAGSTLDFGGRQAGMASDEVTRALEITGAEGDEG
jgi:hypothetical protein